ncbi:PHB depolymerase family esterase [Fibrobacter sp.]|uniref:prolyl oligopeptidase family serine peptidase n=1 Tax=Fibrobacter sp. TaxID=35828 RepID=UPI002621E21A|nr:PHB depolymerase family esterase [Fibrobacter sp.]MDD5943740.1 PHB depolymerase family esterase [Fibrobacter sp.]
MRNPQIANIASIALLGLLSSQAFAWSIDGVVKSKISGRLLGGVKISTFNFSGYETTSAEDGTFRLSGDGTTAIAGTKASNVALHMEGNMLTIYNADARSLSVSVINSLGKVLKKNNIENVQGIVSLDLGKLAQGAKFIRVSADNRNSTFMVTDKGVTALKKESDLLPMHQFAMEGYANFVYQMQAETETGVTIEMVRPASSSSTEVKPAESSSSQQVEPPKSSSSASNDEPIVVDCSGKTAQSDKDETVKLTVQGSSGQRSFIMHVPSAYKGDKPVPLVIDYHPIGGSSEGQMKGTTYKSQTDPEGVITLYPQGTTKTMGPGWNVGPCCSNDDDLEFTREMIKYVREKACIDPQRIYATGFSMGGGMSNHVACMMSDVFAAVAPAAMDLNKTNSAKCTKARPISVINFRGTADQVCKYQGGDSGYNDGLNFLGAEGTFKYWAEADGCTGAPTTNSDGCQEYSNCRDGVKVVLCTKQGGQHEQGDGRIGWPFLKQFTLPASFVK